MRLKVAERHTRSPRARRTTASVVGLLLMLVLTSCSQETEDQVKRLGLPDPASDRSEYMHDLWIGSWIAAGIIGVFVWALIFYTVIRYRRRSREDVPVQIRYNLPIEVLYTIAPIIIVAVLFFFTVKAQNDILENVDPEHKVVVTAQQWSWTFNYVKEDSIGGESVYDTGTPEYLPELWLVEDQPVKFELNSADVIHDFWVPSFYFKQDVVPGIENQFGITPTTQGEYVGRCAELCGVLHSRMLFTVIVTDQASFDAHMQELQDAGQTGVLEGGDNQQSVDGLLEAGS